MIHTKIYFEPHNFIIAVQMIEKEKLKAPQLKRKAIIIIVDETPCSKK